jgi:hypothetical protein
MTAYKISGIGKAEFVPALPGGIAKGGAMDSKHALCAKCSQRIDPSEVRTVYQGIDYHQTCFLKLVHEQAAEEKARRAFGRAQAPSDALLRAR